MDLGGWLRSLGLEAFRENAIDDTVLPSLTYDAFPAPRGESPAAVSLLAATQRWLKFLGSTREIHRVETHRKWPAAAGECQSNPEARKSGQEEADRRGGI
jgi:hypothetical protein